MPERDARAEQDIVDSDGTTCGLRDRSRADGHQLSVPLSADKANATTKSSLALRADPGMGRIRKL